MDLKTFRKLAKILHDANISDLEYAELIVELISIYQSNKNKQEGVK